MASTHSHYISTEEFARRLGVSPATVLKRIQKGKLQAKKIGRSYAVAVAHLQYPFSKETPSPALDQQNYLSIIQAAEILQISRVAVFKKIKKGQLSARKVGRHYVIPKAELIKEDKELSIIHPALQREYVSVVEFAEMTGTSRITIFNRIQKGMIKAQKIGRHYVIAREDVPVEGKLLAKATVSADQYVSVAQAALMLGMSRIAVFKKIQQGIIKAQRIGRSYALLKTEVQERVRKKTS